MDRRYLLLFVIVLLIIAGVFLFYRKPASENTELTKNETKTIEAEGKSFIVEYSKDYIEAKVGDVFDIDFNIKVLTNTTVYFLTMVVPAGIECSIYRGEIVLKESGVITMRFRISEEAQKGLNRVWFSVRDELGNSKDIWITINVVS